MKPTKQQKAPLPFSAILKASFLYEAAIHPMRQQIIGLLLLEKRLPALAIADILFLEEEVCVQQLSILCGVGLVIRQTEDGDVFYRLDRQKLEQLYACAEVLLDE